MAIFKCPKLTIEERCFEYFIDSFFINIIVYKFDTILKYICMIEICIIFGYFLLRDHKFESCGGKVVCVGSYLG